jgi:spermidine/putrescine transport system permease protein
MMLQNKVLSINKPLESERNFFKKTLGLFATLFPIIIWMTAFFVIPLIFIIVVSFCSRGETGNVIYNFTLSNYAKLVNPLYTRLFFNSILIAIFTTLFCLIFGYPFAYIIASANKKYKPLLLLLVIMPFSIALVLIMSESIPIPSSLILRSIELLYLFIVHFILPSSSLPSDTLSSIVSIP